MGGVSGAGVSIGLNGSGVGSLGVSVDEDAVPRLDLQFLNTSSLPSNITFSRSGATGTYFNSSGTLVTASANTPRFDYDPATLQPRGLLIEEARVNLLQWSNDLSQASVWTKTVGVTLGAPATVAGITLSRVQFTTAGFQNIAVSATTAYTVSAVFQVGSGADKVGIHIDDRTTPANAIDCQFNVTGSAIGLTSSYLATVGFTGLSAYGVSLGNGLYRLVLTFTTPTGCASIGTLFEAKYSGTATSGFSYIGACQSEQGTFPTSIIPTVGATATRNNDVATIALSTFPFNAARGTLVAEAMIESLASSAMVVAVLDDGTANNRVLMSIFAAAGAPNAFTVSGGVTTSIVPPGTWTALTTIRTGIAWIAGSSGACLAGGAVTVGSPAAVPIGLTTLRLGVNSANVAQLNGWIRRVRYYPMALGSSTLKALTQG